IRASTYNAKEEDGYIAVPGGGTINNKKSVNSAFKQPILTAGTVLPAFFIPTGIGLYVRSNNIKEFEGKGGRLSLIDYTGTEKSSPCLDCSQSFSWNSTRQCTCALPFSLEQPFESNVFMYYGLSNFYQNHQRNVKSRDDGQLNGDPTSLMNPSKECEPYARNENMPVVPSIFNDTLELYYIDPNGTRIQIPLKGIAWSTDKHVKFRNPGGNPNLTSAFQGKQAFSYELDTDTENNGFINEDFVWMRTAALPIFCKLYRIIQKNNNVTPTLPQGNYTLDVTYNYPVCSFEGRKRVILNTVSWMGVKNPYLGIAYITVGSVCFFLGVVLLIHHKYGNRNHSADIPN
uniref:Cell cycle control protein n=1 Tax=Salmo trutta TaxID=8032 RepID=A0A674EIH4_SALTR